MGKPISRGDFIRTIERLDRITLPKDCTLQISGVQCERIPGDDCPPAEYQVNVTLCIGLPPAVPVVLDLVVTHVPTDADLAALHDFFRKHAK